MKFLICFLLFFTYCIDNNQDENWYETSKAFHGSSVQFKHVMCGKKWLNATSKKIVAGLWLNLIIWSRCAWNKTLKRAEYFSHISIPSRIFRPLIKSALRKFNKSISENVRPLTIFCLPYKWEIICNVYQALFVEGPFLYKWPSLMHKSCMIECRLQIVFTSFANFHSI